MTPPWGINWQCYHKDRYDMPHVEKMGYRSFTIYEWMWSDRGFCNELLSVARKDAIFLNRDHPLSEQKDDLWRSDPAQKGRNHADEWAQKVREGKVHTPLDRTYFLGLNEPDSNHYQRQIDAYNEAFCRRMAQHGLRAAAYSFGVGHPSTVGLQPKAPVDWSWYDASAAAILEGDHIAAFHEYGEPNGYGWGHWCNRLEACPHPFNVVLDECGIDHGVLQSGYLYGWAIALKPEEYVAWLDAFQLGMAERAHTRKVKILAYNIFSFDHGRGDTKDWHSFDIRPLRSLLESYKWSEPAKQNTHIPIVHGGPTPVEKPITKGTVTAHLLNIRGGADANAPVVGQLRQGDTLNIYEIRDLGTHAWYRIGNGEWVHSGWVQRTDEGPKPVQESQTVEEPKAMWVSVPAGANLRSAPMREPVLVAIPYGERVEMLGRDSVRPNWLYVRYRDKVGHIREDLLSPNEITSSPAPGTGDNWERAWPIVLRIEGGLSLDPNDSGNYYQGKLVGTKYGISAAVWGGQYDIPNLTKEQALEIYKKHYWEASGADKLPWPMCLIHFDTAVQHGVAVANKLLNYKPSPEEQYLGQRALRYMDDPKWRLYGEAWGVRIDHLQDIVRGE